MTFPKLIVFINSIIPLALLLWDLSRNRVGPNPLEFATRTTGMLTLIFLCLTLAVTPLRKIFGINSLVKYRRMLGLFAFFYGALHFVIYIVTTFFIEGFSNFDASGLAADLTTRPYIMAGFTAFVLMIPLAVTSTQGWIRRLGGRNWNWLHKLIYITAIAAVLHYWWKVSVKLPPVNPRNYAILVAILLAFRLWRHFAKRAASEV